MDGVTGWNQNAANWSQGSFAYGDDGDEASLWRFIVSDGDIVGFENDQVDPSRFYIPAGKQVRITQDTIINGHGRTLVLEQNAGIIVDANVTCTLKNMRIRNTRNNASNPMFLASHQLALENVELELADDSVMLNGELFIHGDVVVSGSHAFTYSSPQPLHVTDGATFGFENGSTFLYNSAINVIDMTNETANLYFNGATLRGIFRMRGGKVFFDNDVRVNVDGFQSDEVFNRDVGASLFGGGWSPDGQLLATGDGNGWLEVFSRTDILNNDATSPVFNNDIGNGFRSMDWSPDGQYLATGTTSGNLKVFSRIDILDDDATSPVFNRDLGDYLSEIGWSPDGQYLATVSRKGRLKVFEHSDVLNDDATTPVFNQILDSSLWTMGWSPDGQYLATGGTSGQLKVFLRDDILNDDSTSPVFNQVISTYWLFEIDWNPDGQYLATGSDDRVRIFSRADILNNDATSPVFNQDCGSGIHSLRWSPNGQYLATGLTNGRLKIFGRADILNDDSTSPIFNQDLGSNLYSMSWSFDGQYLATGDGNGRLKVREIIQEIVFGDSSLPNGTGDVDVKMLAGADVFVDGKIKFDM